MIKDIDLGKISIVPKGTWNSTVQVEYNDIWKHGDSKYLALKDSIGIQPKEDGENWFELSSKGKSAYEEAIDKGFIGTEEEWINSLKQPALDAAGKVDVAIDSIDKRFPEKINQIKEDLEKTIDESVTDKTVRPYVISSRENKVGSFKMGTDDITIYERAVELINLPTNINEEKEYIISDEPLGYGLYFNVDSFSVTTGKGLSSKFFNFNYRISDYYINDNLQSIIKIECIKGINETVKGVLNIRYCKFYGDVVEFEITLPEGINKENISLEIPPLKFNKKLIFSYITDDSNSIYQYQFAPINKRFVPRTFKLPDGRKLVYHMHMDGKPEFQQYVFDSYYPKNFMQCTDGAGVKRRYSTTVAAWTDKLINNGTPDFDAGMQYPWISAKEFKFFRDFGFSIAYHDLDNYSGDGLNQEKFDEFVSNTARKFQEYVGITPKFLVEPNGDHKYLEFAKANEIIQFSTAQSGHSLIQTVYPHRQGFTMDKQSVSIQRIFAYGDDLTYEAEMPKYVVDMINKLKDYSNESDPNNISWLICAAHACSHWESNLFKSIHENFGDIGLDNLWFTTPDEMYEYWFMRTNTVFSKLETPTGLKFKLYIPKMPNFWYRDISVMLSGISSLDGIQVNSGNNVYGTSYNINDGKLLVNLNFDEKLLERTEKYVSIFENDYNTEYNYDNAFYFVQQLKEPLKSTYLERINKYISPPKLMSVVINNGDSTTKDKNVNVKLTYSGQAPSHYQLSESSNFIGAEWLNYTDHPNFSMSGSFGNKTIYARLKNVYGESNSLSDSIEYLEPDLVFNSILINNGDDTTSNNLVNVLFKYSGFPTHYRLSNTETFANEWVEFTNDTVNFTLNEGIGNKTVYAQIKNSKTTSTTKNDTIELVDVNTVKLNSIVINDGEEYSNSNAINIKFNITNSALMYRIAESEDGLNIASWKAYNSSVSYTAGVTTGLINIYAQVKNNTNESEVKSDSITVVKPIVLSSMKLAGDQSEYTGLRVPVTFEITDGTATHYRLSESEAGINNAAWEIYSEDVSYSFQSLGTKTLYGQVKNQLSTSSIVNSSITLKEAPVKILLANVPKGGTDVPNVGFVQAINNGNNKIDLKNTSGVKVGSLCGNYIPYNQEAYTAMNNKYDVINCQGGGNTAYWSFPTLIGTGKYPNTMITDGTSKNIVVPIRSSFTDFNKGRFPVILTELASGTYNVNILLCDNGGIYDSYPWVLQVQNQIKQVTKEDEPTYVVKNNTNWYNFNNVTVDSDGYLFIAQGFATDQTSAPGHARIAPMCIIEIEKK